VRGKNSLFLVHPIHTWSASSSGLPATFSPLQAVDISAFY